jgi:hypothetical protein
MSSTDKIFVDELFLLPQIIGACFSERRGGIQMARDFEYPGTNCRENLLDGLNDSMIEGMYRAVGRRFPDHSHDERLDVSPLYLHIDSSADRHRAEDFLQGGNKDTAAEVKLTNLARWKLGDRQLSSEWHTTGVEHGIMMNDNNSIARSVHVELDRIGAEIERFQESGDGVLRKRVMCATVGDALRGAPGWWGQPGLRVVAFGR